MPCDLDDVRLIAAGLPDALAGEDGQGFSVGGRGFVWVYPERVDPKSPRVPNPEIVVIMVDDLAEKEALLAEDPVIFFSTDHYNGHRSVIVRLTKINRPRLAELITDAHATIAAMPAKRPRKRRR